MKNMIKSFGAVALVAVLFTVAFAAVTFDPATGQGFAGKGDVQLALGFNNKQLQDQAASLVFTYEGVEETVTEVTWGCTNSNNENLQERARTTTTSSSRSDVVSAVAREKNQITGFNLNGYRALNTVSSSTTEGPAVNSCPSGPWILTDPAGAPDVISSTSTGGLYVDDVLLQ
jgi:hypothetical protein